MSTTAPTPSILPSPFDFLSPSSPFDLVPPIASPPSPPPSSDSPPPAPPPAPAAPPPSPPPPPAPASAPSPPLRAPSPSPSPISQPPIQSPSPSPQSAPSPLVSTPKATNHPSPPNSKSPPVPSSHEIPPPPPASSRISGGLVVGVALGSVAVLAVFGFLWLLFSRKKRRRSPYDIEGYYLPKDAYYSGSARQVSYPPSAEFPSNHSHSPMEVVPSMPNSGGFSSVPPQQPLSTGGSEGGWSSSSVPANLSVPSSSGIVVGSMTSAFTYEELSMATDGFSNLNLLGQGGFGYVHKGILPTGKIIAVKSLKAGSGQGEREFQAEVETISRVHHKHLVSLVGYSVTGPQKLLVYEFVANKTLEFHLHGKGQPVMDWATRLRIAVGAAKGLAYLHEDCHPKVIHRDIKAANILLEFNFEAKVADFGLARFTSDVNTHVSTRVMGTFGYMAPEYASSGKLTEKSDVFSFGVVLLELITGRRPIADSPEMEDSLVDLTRPLLANAVQEGKFDELVDPRLANNYNFEEIGCMITCAACCVRHSARRRPKMSKVVRALEGNLPLSHLNDGVKPGFSSFQGSVDIDHIQKKEEQQRLRRTAISSEDYSSSEFSEHLM